VNVDRAESQTRPADAVAPPSAIGGLRAATWPSHQRLEKRIDVKARFASVDAYRAHLENLLGFIAALEARIPVDLFGAALPDYPSRRKQGLLEQDLAALGLGPDAIAGLPRCPDVPAPRSIAEAFGCVYVLEGATLGGRTLLPVVTSRLTLDAGRGATFLASYGESVAPMWGRFGIALDAWCCDAPRRDAAEATAVATFEALERWLCRSRS